MNVVVLNDIVVTHLGSVSPIPSHRDATIIQMVDVIMGDLLTRYSARSRLPLLTEKTIPRSYMWLSLHHIFLVQFCFLVGNQASGASLRERRLKTFNAQPSFTAPAPML